MVACGDDTGHDDGVDEAARHSAAGLLEDDGEGTGAGILAVETGIGVGHVQADHEDRKDVKHQNPPEDIAHNTGEILGRILGLSGGDGNGLGTSAAVRCQR